MPDAEKPGFIRKTLAYIGDPAVATWRKVLGGGVAALYVLVPFDIIPDFIPILGWLDDLGMVGMVGWYMVRQINKHAKARARLPPPPPPPTLSR